MDGGSPLQGCGGAGLAERATPQWNINAGFGGWGGVIRRGEGRGV